MTFVLFSFWKKISGSYFYINNNEKKITKETILQKVIHTCVYSFVVYNNMVYGFSFMPYSIYYLSLFMSFIQHPTELSTHFNGFYEKPMENHLIVLLYSKPINKLKKMCAEHLNVGLHESNITQWKKSSLENEQKKMNECYCCCF